MQDDTIIMIARLERHALEAVQRRMSSQQLGEAFRDLPLPPPCTPLLTTLVPDGMPSLIRRQPVQRINIRKATR